jgi:hypothetical protein
MLYTFSMIWKRHSKASAIDMNTIDSNSCSSYSPDINYPWRMIRQHNKHQKYHLVKKGNWNEDSHELASNGQLSRRTSRSWRCPWSGEAHGRPLEGQKLRQAPGSQHWRPRCCRSPPTAHHNTVHGTPPGERSRPEELHKNRIKH